MPAEERRTHVHKEAEFPDEEDVTRMAKRWTDYEMKLYDAIPEHQMQHEYRHVPRYVKQYVWNRDGGRCVECGTKENLEYDHIIPISKGGSNFEGNVRLLCKNCNRKKHAKIM